MTAPTTPSPRVAGTGWTLQGGLPDIHGQWPPPPYDDAVDAMDVWNAWYCGDRDRLFEHYSSDNAPTRPIQYESGFKGRFARFFWGRPSKQVTHRLHVPAAADLARTSADLLFSQPPRFTIGEGDSPNRKAAQDRLDKLLGSPEAAATMLEAAELQAALGGAFVRLWWDKDVTDKIEIGSVAADCALPEWRYGRLVGASFWTVVHKDRKAVYRHLERHAKGSIEHALYFGTEDSLGSKISLEELPTTAWAADIVDDEGRIPTGVNGLTAAYVPNVRPNRLWRNIPGLSGLGRSDFDGLEPLFDALDDAYSSWMRDVDLGKARIFIDENMLANRGPGKGANFDMEQEVFTKLKPAGALKDAGQIHSEQFAIRWAEHSNTCAEILNSILRGAGYSAANFTDDSLTVTKTATEIASRDRLSERTRDKKINYWRAALTPLAATMIELDQQVFGTRYSIDEAPEVHFPVRPQMSQAELSGSLSALRSANLISIEQGVRERNPNWPDDEIKAEVKRIEADRAAEYQMGSGQTPYDDGYSENSGDEGYGDEEVGE